MLHVRPGLLFPVLPILAACTSVSVSQRPYDEPFPETHHASPETPRVETHPVSPPPAPGPRPETRVQSPAAPLRIDPTPTPPSALPAPSAETPLPPGLPEPAKPAPSTLEGITPAAAPPAIVALRGEAESSLASGELDNAAAALERAIRIQPNNAELWHQLAVVRLRQGQPTQAEDLAQRSNLQARGRTDLVRANWAIIADARRQQGDVDGAAVAAIKAGQ